MYVYIYIYTHTYVYVVLGFIFQTNSTIGNMETLPSNATCRRPHDISSARKDLGTRHQDVLANAKEAPRT